MSHRLITTGPRMPTGTPNDAAAEPTGARTGAAWFAVCTTALILGLLVVFMLQNTRSTEVSFLWTDGTAPLALALLVAGVAAGVVVAVVVTARIARLRPPLRGRRHS